MCFVGRPGKFAYFPLQGFRTSLSNHKQFISHTRFDSEKGPSENLITSILPETDGVFRDEITDFLCKPFSFYLFSKGLEISEGTCGVLNYHNFFH